MIEFAHFTDEERPHVETIVRRAIALNPLTKQRPLDIQMDLAAVHHHTPLRLADLAASDAANFAHDVLGIYANLDRRTGKLRNCFLPRFSA